MNRKPSILELREITKTFPGVIALDSVDLSIEEGEVHVLVGENGAGKTTLAKGIARGLGAAEEDDIDAQGYQHKGAYTRFGEHAQAL